MSEVSKQLSWANTDYRSKEKQTRRGRFLSAMKGVRRWAELVEELRPLYSKGGARSRGRPQIAFLGRTLHVLCARASTKSGEKARDGDMHKARQRNQCFLGMNAHIGAELQGTEDRSLSFRATHAADIAGIANLLLGGATTIFADAGYAGAGKRPELKNREVRRRIVEKHGNPSHSVNKQFGHCKTRYRAPKKDANDMQLLFG
jgi:hypothetical protein